MRKVVMVALVGGGLALGGTAVAGAGELGQGGADPGGVTRETGAGAVSAVQAADLALRQVGDGRVVGVQQTDGPGGTAYRVTVLTGAGEQTVMVDGATGQATGGRRGDYPGQVSEFPTGRQDRKNDRRQGDPPPSSAAREDQRGGGAPGDQRGEWTWDFSGQRSGVSPNK
jgi:hypothetical protein